jgi:RNA polymerase sigma factor (sigma-70 family)
MDDSQTDDLLRRLRSRQPGEAWAAFLERYSPLLISVIRRFERDEDGVEDCYIFVCEQLSRDGFRRLLRYHDDGLARFSTWLCVVTRNLCLDWHRHEFGRQRVFESIAGLPPLEQEIFRALFVDLLPRGQALLSLGPRFPGLTVEQVNEGVRRVEQALNSRQRWLLEARRMRGIAPGSAAEHDADTLGQLHNAFPSPETWAELREQRAALAAGMTRLTPRERLLIRLRFERELTFGEIARLLKLDSPQSADRVVRAAVDRLRKAITR